jgi:hypothetical protein
MINKYCETHIVLKRNDQPFYYICITTNFWINNINIMTNPIMPTIILKMSPHSQLILADLLQPINEFEDEYEPPYNSSASFEEKFNLIKQALLQAKRIQNQSLQLLNAYFLGQLLEKEAETLSQRGYYAKKLTTYYRIVSVRTFYLFEVFGTKKVMNATRTSLMTVRRLKSDEFRDLVLKASIIFNGVENLGEE